jgi:hypothetical protein
MRNLSLHYFLIEFVFITVFSKFYASSVSGIIRIEYNDDLIMARGKQYSLIQSEWSNKEMYLCILVLCLLNQRLIGLKINFYEYGIKYHTDTQVRAYVQM